MFVMIADLLYVCGVCFYDVHHFELYDELRDTLWGTLRGIVSY